jgi:cytoskeletal protein CcmA (bactofilin family)
VIAESGNASILVISEQAVIDGEVRAGHVVVNGVINGPVFSTELIELQSKARISGDVVYKALEMMNGALVSGKLAHDQNVEPVLKLAASN